MMVHSPPRWAKSTGRTRNLPSLPRWPQEFCGVLQEEAAAITGAALRVAAADLGGYRLPEAASLQHAAVQHVQLMAQLLGQQ